MFDIEKYVKDFFTIPEPAAKRLWVEEYEEMIVHTQGVLPTKLISTRRPYEDKKILDYRLKNYEPITKNSINRATGNIQRIVRKSGVNYDLPEELKTYLDSTDFEGTSFFNYITSDPIARMIEDPNGVLIWWADGLGLTESNTKVNAKPILVLSSKIKHLDKDYFSFLSAEKSQVTVGNKTTYKGDVYYIVTRQGQYKLIQYGKKSSNLFKVENHYINETNFLPVIILKGSITGETQSNGNEIKYYESVFSTFKAFGNESIRQYSDHQGIMVTSAFPIRDQEPIACTNTLCKNGTIYTDDDSNPCGTCHGSGYIEGLSPYGVYTRPKREGLNQDKTPYVPMVNFISPDVSILKYAGEYWEKLLDKAEKSLNLIFIDAAQSGKAKEIDREDKESMLDRIGSDIVLGIIANSIIIINSLRDINADSKDILVTLPDTFKIRSENELVADLKTLKDSGAPSFLITETVTQIIKQKYGHNWKLIKIAKVLASIDPYFAYSLEDKQSLNASGVMTSNEFITSLHSGRITSLVCDKYGADFRNMDIDKIIAEVEKDLQPLLNKGIINPDGTSV